MILIEHTIGVCEVIHHKFHFPNTINVLYQKGLVSTTLILGLFVIIYWVALQTVMVLGGWIAWVASFHGA